MNAIVTHDIVDRIVTSRDIAIELYRSAYGALDLAIKRHESAGTCGTRDKSISRPFHRL